MVRGAGLAALLLSLLVVTTSAHAQTVPGGDAVPDTTSTTAPSDGSTTTTTAPDTTTTAPAATDLSTTDAAVSAQSTRPPVRGGFQAQQFKPASAGQSVQDMDAVTAQQLAASLAGAGVTVSNATFTGDVHQGGTFDGFGPAFGFGSGVVLDTGSVVTDDTFTSSIIGPNVPPDDDVEARFGRPGDSDLNALTGGSGTTQDAAVLEFDFVPTTSQLSFKYAFGSEEYNNFVGTQFNDVFGFFVNGANCAVVGGQPVTINNINGGNPDNSTPPSNPQFYRDNDPTDGSPAPIDTELDGLTTVLTCTANVNATATNHIKLAIGDTSDDRLDSAVMIQAGSFKANNPPVAEDGSATTTADTPVDITLQATDPDGDSLTFAAASQPANGTLTGSGATVTYTPNPGFVGSDSFTFVANDGAADSNVATISIEVSPPPISGELPRTGTDARSQTSLGFQLLLLGLALVGLGGGLKLAWAPLGRHGRPIRTPRS
jgi:hypothetical protein